MRKYLIGMFIMLLMLKPMVGAALVYIFADGMQSAAAAMAEGRPGGDRYRYPDSYYEFRERRDQQSGVAPTVAPVRIETEEQVHAIIEKREQHRQEQVENQQKEEIIIETARGEQVGVELFDEEFNKKYPSKKR